MATLRKSGRDSTSKSSQCGRPITKTRCPSLEAQQGVGPQTQEEMLSQQAALQALPGRRPCGTQGRTQRDPRQGSDEGVQAGQADALGQRRRRGSMYLSCPPLSDNSYATFPDRPAAKLNVCDPQRRVVQTFQFRGWQLAMGMATSASPASWRGRLARVAHVDALAESLDATELLFLSFDVDEPDLAIALAGGRVDVGDFELEIRVVGLCDDALDELGGDALASATLGDGDEFDVARVGRVVELRCPLRSKDSRGQRASHQAEAAAPVGG